MVKFLNLAPDYFERYIERINELDPEVIQQEITTWIRPKELIIMVVGDEARFTVSLETLGEVVPVELDNP